MSQTRLSCPGCGAEVRTSLSTNACGCAERIAELEKELAEVQAGTDRVLALYKSEYQEHYDAVNKRLADVIEENTRLRAVVEHRQDLLCRSYRLQKLHTEAMERHLRASEILPTAPKPKEAKNV